MIGLNKILFVVSIIVLMIVGFGIVKSRNKKEPLTIKTQAQNKFISQENEGKNVKVIVTPKTLAVGEKPSFNIVFETHSVDLNFDVAQISSLVDEKGKVFNNSIWEGTGPGGHHRNGDLTFNEILSKTKLVKLIIKNVAGVLQRKLRWEL